MLIRLSKPRWGSGRVVLIPNQWNGSVQQYFHFLLGYLAPVFAWATKNPSRPIAVRDCGPMNRWFDLLRPEHDVEIMTVGDVLHVLAGDLQPHRVLRGMDFPDRFSRTSIVAFADATYRLSLERARPLRSHPRIIVSDRASSDDFFSTPAAEWPESGSQKRSVPNLREAIQSMDLLDAHIMDAAQVDIYEQIVLHSRAKVLVGQHGAGLTNMIWMTPGSWVVEILPPMPHDAQHIFRNLAKALGLRYIMVPQDALHAPVDLPALRAAIATTNKA